VDFDDIDNQLDAILAELDSQTALNKMARVRAVLQRHTERSEALRLRLEFPEAIPFIDRCDAAFDQGFRDLLS
jgi:hypothetical protein